MADDSTGAGDTGETGDQHHRVERFGPGFRVWRPPGARRKRDHAYVPHDGSLHYWDAMHVARAESALHGAGLGSSTSSLSKILRGIAWRHAKRAMPPLGHADEVGKALNTVTKKRSNLFPEDVPAAKAAAAAYGTDASRKKAVPGFEYLPTLSSDEFAVWDAKDHSRAIVAFRGTKGNDDVKSDAYLAAGGLARSPRWKRDVKRLKYADRALGFTRGLPVLCVGHSLGGGLAILAAKWLQDHGAAAKAVALNPGIGLDGIAKAKIKPRVYQVRGDLVSGLAPLSYRNADIHLLEPKTNGTLERVLNDPLTAHGADQFVDAEEKTSSA